MTTSDDKKQTQVRCSVCLTRSVFVTSRNHTSTV